MLLFTAIRYSRQASIQYAVAAMFWTIRCTRSLHCISLRMYSRKTVSVVNGRVASYNGIIITRVADVLGRLWVWLVITTIVAFTADRRQLTSGLYFWSWPTCFMANFIAVWKPQEYGRATVCNINVEERLLDRYIVWLEKMFASIMRLRIRNRRSRRHSPPCTCMK